MQITVQIPQAEALKRGSARWGAQAIDLEAVLALLTEEERARIEVATESPYHRAGQLLTDWAAMNVNGGATQRRPVEAPTTEPGDVVAAIRASLATVAETREQLRAEAQAGLDALLADPDGLVRGDGTRRYDYADGRLATIAQRAGVDAAPYEAALAAAVERRLDVLRAWLREQYDPAATDYVSPWQRGYHSREETRRKADALGCADVVARIDTYEAETKARNAAATADREQRQAASREAWTDWGRRHGSEDLRAAIADEYPLGKRVEQEVVTALLPTAPAGMALDREIGPEADDGDRRVPSAAARAGRESLAAAVKAIPSDLVPAGTEIEVGRVRALSWDERCDCVTDGYTDPECPRKHDDDGDVTIRRTGVPVTIRAAHHTDIVWYLVEE